MNILQVALGGLFAICCFKLVKLYSPDGTGGNPRVKTPYSVIPDRLCSSETALKLSPEDNHSHYNLPLSWRNFKQIENKMLKL